MIDFWTLLKNSRASEGGHFDATLKRALELEANIPRDAVAWLKMQWPELELYLYTANGDDSPLEAIKEHFVVTRAERPVEYGRTMDIDWIVRITIP